MTPPRTRPKRLPQAKSLRYRAGSRTWKGTLAEINRQVDRDLRRPGGVGR